MEVRRKVLNYQVTKSDTLKLTDNIVEPTDGGKRWLFGAQILHQKEVIVPDSDDEKHGNQTNSDMSLSLLNTPNNINERKMANAAAPIPKVIEEEELEHQEPAA